MILSAIVSLPNVQDEPQRPLGPLALASVGLFFHVFKPERIGQSISTYFGASESIQCRIPMRGIFLANEA